MEDKLIELLESFGHRVVRQGSIGPKEKYPDTFFTFWNNDEVESSAYDNMTTSVEYDFDVNVYSTDPEKAYSLLREARVLLKQNGFTIITRGYDVASDEPTHVGRGTNVLYIEMEG